jgi:hypothetical protein
VASSKLLEPKRVSFPWWANWKTLEGLQAASREAALEHLYSV